jgi:hypothetical protein
MILAFALAVPSTALGSSGHGMSSLASVVKARMGTIHAQWDPYFYYDPYDPCQYTSCDNSYYTPSADYYFDPGSSCDASICDAGYIDPVGDFYYDPGSSTDSSLIDTSSVDWSGGGDAAADVGGSKTNTPSGTGASLAHALRHTGRGTASRASVYTFVDNARSYRLVYAYYWQRFTSRGIDFGARDPDGNAAVDALAVTVPPGQAVNFNQVLHGYFYALGATPVTGEEQSVSYLGDTRQAAEVEFQWNRTGVYGGTVVVMIQDHGRAYLLAGVVADVNAPSVQQDALHVSSVISSLDVLHIFVVPKRLAARFTDKTHSYRFTYAKDWSRQSGRASRADFVLRSPDKSAAVVSLSVAAPKHANAVTARNMHDLVSVVGRQVGRVTGKPVYHAVMYKGVPRRMVTFTYQAPNGQKGRIFIVAALHHRRICVVAGVVLNTPQATANRDAARVSAMISSLGFV